ncbi:peptidoglycan editing factor PgeF [Ramlibacter sp. G-1-2-2]|uniref:Purine nucleoside phosphorylase n=1 Tax=Ramlibacter agri TaxID=2728837 RepID=A0A848HBM2_9BURK|nr:peptidoglycan editing factor PgeF [Ramlibacter agri]
MPDWPAPQGVRAACSTRVGGVSLAPYDTLNLGGHVGDREEAVAENRARYAQELRAKPVFLNQVHGQSVVRLDAQTPHGAEADACWTTERGLACTMMVADCLPVLLADARGRVVGAAHCGWRGLAGGVLEALWRAMASQVQSDPQRMLAWLGPCIGPDAFEVGQEVRNAFLTQDAGAGACFRPHASPGKLLADLPALARRRLQALGITAAHGNDGSTEWCTVTNPSRFFSHRRDRVSGRFAASAWLA